MRLINVDGNNTGIDQIISMVPDVVGKVKGVIENRKTKKAQKSGNDFAEITSDDVDVWLVEYHNHPWHIINGVCLWKN